MKLLSTILTLSFGLCFIGCNQTSSKKNNHSLSIDSIKTKLFNDSSGLNKETALLLIEAYEKAFKKTPHDTNNPKYLLAAGDLASTLKYAHKAIHLYSLVIDSFPNSSEAKLALFQKAVVYDDISEEEDLAKVTYQEFINTYPNHPLAVSAQNAISLLGKSLEDIVKEFENKNP